MCLSLGLLLLVVGAAAAQTAVEQATEAQKTAATRAYKRGKRAFLREDFKGALRAFQQSYEAVASPNSRLMIAQSLAALGQPVAAYELFGEVIADVEASGSAKFTAAGKSAQEQREQLRSRIALLTVTVVGADAEATLEIAGRPLPRERWGTPVPVEPGSAKVRLVTALGRADEFVELGPGSSGAIEINAPAPPEPRKLVDVDFEAGPGPEPGPTPSEPGDDPLERRARLGLAVGLKVGGSLGAPFNDWDASYVLEAELQWLLPLGSPLGHRLGVFVSGQYTAPGSSGTDTTDDPRLPSGSELDYELDQQVLALGAGLVFRVPLGERVMPYLGAGARLYMTKAELAASVGDESIPTQRETQQRLGVLGLIGTDIFVGPGALLAELQIGYAALDGVLLRDTNLGSLSLALGYRLIL